MGIIIIELQPYGVIGIFMSHFICMTEKREFDETISNFCFRFKDD